MYFAGLDIGTTGCKAVLYDENGNFVRSAYKEYDVSRKGGLHEIDVLMLWEAVKQVLKKTADSKTAAIAVTSFGETFTILDSDDKPIAASMLYTDPRGKKECRLLSEHFGVDVLTEKIGTRPHEMYSVVKLMHIKRNSPEVFEKANAILLMQDYIVYKLSGIRQIDYSLAARTACFDVVKKRWDKEILNFAEIDEKLFSTPVPTGTAAGAIRSELAAELGLSENTIIVSGAHDQIAAMLGAGIRTNDRVMDGTGTVECVPVLFDAIPHDPKLFDYGYSFVPHPDGRYACYVLSYTGGATLKWFRDRFSDLSYSELDRLVSENPSELLILPHFAGAATPYMDSSSKAAVVGLTFEHTKMDIYRALMEGTAFEIAVNFDILKEDGLCPKAVYATGGGAKSDIWLQIKADVLGLSVIALDCEEIGGAGTAWLAGYAVGAYDKNVQLAKQRKSFIPDLRRHKFYQTQLKKYKKLYPAVKDILQGE